MEQMIIKLIRHDGQFYNFFNTPGSIDSLKSFLDRNWVVKEMDINKQSQEGWVLLERSFH